MEGEEIIKLELSTNELVDVALRINYAIDMDDVAPSTIKLVMLNVMHHCCPISY